VHRVLSEEFSSRVAESTRLILVKDGFGGDLGALDRWTDERRKDTKIKSGSGRRSVIPYVHFGVVLAA
jgi:hypothetical protein